MEAVRREVERGHWSEMKRIGKRVNEDMFVVRKGKAKIVYKQITWSEFFNSLESDSA